MEIKHRSELWKLFADTPGAIAEVGVAEGRYSLEMVQWAPVTRLYLVDRWASHPGQKGDGGFPQLWHQNNLREAKHRLFNFKDKVEFLRGESVLMVETLLNESLVLVYIDADHSYEGCARDLRAWSKKVKPGGFIACHDYLTPQYGVKRAVDEFCQEHGYVTHIVPEHRDCDASVWFQII